MISYHWLFLCQLPHSTLYDTLRRVSKSKITHSNPTYFCNVFETEYDIGQCPFIIKTVFFIMDRILKMLISIEQKITEQNLLQKEIFNFQEACLYLDLSSSHLYKLTSANQVPCYSPQGKKLYFRRAELDKWLTCNRRGTAEEAEQSAAHYIAQKKGGMR